MLLLIITTTTPQDKWLDLSLDHVRLSNYVPQNQMQ